MSGERIENLEKLAHAYREAAARTRCLADEYDEAARQKEDRANQLRAAGDKQK